MTHQALHVAHIHGFGSCMALRLDRLVATPLGMGVCCGYRGDVASQRIDRFIFQLR
jgi:hypothetical protein